MFGFFLQVVQLVYIQNSVDELQNTITIKNITKKLKLYVSNY